MRLLLVEDEEGTAQELIGRIREHLELPAIDWERCSDEAERRLRANTYDVILIDLALPVYEGDPERQIENGRRLESIAAQELPGAVRLFVSAYPSDHVKDHLSTGEAGPFLFDGDRYALVQHFTKEFGDLQRLLAELAQLEQRLSSLDEIELEDAARLDIDDKRAFALAVRIAGGHSARVVRRHGRSSSTTAVLECLHASDAQTGHAFIKVGSPSEIARELEGYARVRFSLQPRYFPYLAERIRVGIGRREALVFTQAPTSQTLFAAYCESPSLASGVIRELSNVLSPWLFPQDVSPTKIGDLRRKFVSDLELADYEAELRAMQIPDVEEVSVPMTSYCQHGDLHGANVLVTDSSQPFLVDFARTGDWFAGLDQAYLEQSMLFHPEGPGMREITVDECRHWHDDEFGRNTHVAIVSSACRDWASAWSLSPRDQAIAGLICALKHLKYPDRSPMHALAIAESCIFGLSI